MQADKTPQFREFQKFCNSLDGNVPSGEVGSMLHVCTQSGNF